ncbi:MAG: hypothetical protein LBN09_05575 [Clostridioides sp.]|jgi:hypothetical protein|nr:hypothetical protein [Clostridioides sp.]
MTNNEKFMNYIKKLFQFGMKILISIGIGMVLFLPSVMAILIFVAIVYSIRINGNEILLVKYAVFGGVYLFGFLSLLSLVVYKNSRSGGMSLQVGI